MRYREWKVKHGRTPNYPFFSVDELTPSGTGG